MVRNTASRTAQRVYRFSVNQRCSYSTIRSRLLPATSTTINARASVRPLASFARSLHQTASACKGISPESEDPQPKEAEDQITATSPTDLTNEEYHEVADRYMDKMVAALEELQEDREDVDVEFSVGLIEIWAP
jgi:frataxin